MANDVPVNDGPNVSEAELQQVRRLYLKSVQVLQRMSSNQEEYSTQAKERNRIEKELLKRGDAKFVEMQKTQQKQFTSFFGEKGQTKRGKTLSVLQKKDEIFRNLKDVVKTDMMHFFTGIGKKNKAAGMEKNSLFSRLLGSDKYVDIKDKPEDDENKPQAPGYDPQSDPQNNPGLGDEIIKTDQIEDGEQIGLLKKIDDNTSTIADLINADLDDRKKREENKDLLETETRREDDKKKGDFFGAKDATKDGKKKGLLGNAVGNFASDFMGNMAGSFSGFFAAGGMKSVMAKAVTAAPVVAGVAALAGGLLWAAIDGFTGYMKSAEWGTSKLSGTIGGVFAGADKGVLGAFKNAGKWALIGAGIGSFVPVIGTLVGGLVGGALGAIIGFFGGEQIAKWLDKAASTLGEWSDRLLGTSFVLDEKALEKEMADLNKKNTDRNSVITEQLAKISSLNDEINKARAEGNTALVEQLTSEKDTLSKGLNDIIENGNADQKRLKDITSESKAARESYLGAMGKWLYNTYVKPYAWISDHLFKTEFVLNKDDLKKDIDAANQDIEKLSHTGKDIADQIVNVTEQIEAAKKAGDKDAETALNKQLDILKNRQKTIATDLESAQARLAEATNLESQSNNRFVDTIVEFGKESIKSLLTGTANWIKKIFSWDYWFGDSDKDADGVKSDVKRAQAAEERRGKFVAQAESQTSHLFGGESQELKDALKQYKEGQIDETKLRSIVEGVQSSGDKNARSDASKVLETMSGYDTYLRELQASQIKGKIEGVENRSGYKLSEANAYDAETDRLQKEKQTQASSTAISNVISTNTVNQHVGIITTSTPYNTDLSFNVGIAGVRSTTYTSGF